MSLILGEGEFVCKPVAAHLKRDASMKATAFGSVHQVSFREGGIKR
jgi:hypothetical protein